MLLLTLTLMGFLADRFEVGGGGGGIKFAENLKVGT